MHIVEEKPPPLGRAVETLSRLFGEINMEGIFLNDTYQKIWFVETFARSRADVSCRENMTTMLASVTITTQYGWRPRRHSGSVMHKESSCEQGIDIKSVARTYGVMKVVRA